jgi:hypothetical protein
VPPLQPCSHSKNTDRMPFRSIGNIFV